MASQPSPSGVFRERRIAYPKRLFWFILMQVIIVIIAITVGRSIGTQGINVSSGNVDVPVYTTVEMRTVSGVRSFPLSADTSNVTQVALPDQSWAIESERFIVTRSYAEVGEQLLSGQPLIEISGRPVFAGPKSLLLYRDLTIGDNGPDVMTVNLFLIQTGRLSGTAQDKFTEDSLNALEEMYNLAGYDLPQLNNDSKGLAWRELVAVSEDGNGIDILETKKLGDLITPGDPFMSVRPGGGGVFALVDPLTAKDLQNSEISSLISNGNGEEELASVLAIEPFKLDPSTGDGGHKVLLASPKTVEFQESPLLFHIKDNEASIPAVPLVSIREDHKGTFILLKSDQGGLTRKPVKVVRNAHGWAGLDSSNRELVGLEVLIP